LSGEEFVHSQEAREGNRAQKGLNLILFCTG
jgi:hypothetical protein